MFSKLKGFMSIQWQMTVMALQYLNGRRLRTVLTTLAIVLGVAMIFAINLFLPAASEAFKRTMMAASGAVDLNITSLTSEAFSPETLQKVAAVENVAAVTGVLRRQILLPTLGSKGAIGETPRIELIGVDPTTVQNVHQYVVSEGRFLEPGDTGKAIIPAGIADMAPQLKVGTTFPLITSGGLKFYTVVGLLAEKGSVTAPQIIITLSDAQAALNQPGLINSIEVSIKAGAERETVGDDVQKALGAGFVLDNTAEESSNLAAMQIGYTMMYALGLVALFIGAFLIFNTFRTVILERRHDLGMLRAIGANRRQLSQMIIVESLLQGLFGVALGLAIGYLIALGAGRVMNIAIARFIPGHTVTIQLTLSAFLVAILIGLLTTFVAGYWPARSAGKITPLEALRPSTGSAVRRSARWSLIAGIVVMVLATVMLIGSSRTSAAGAVLFLVGMVIAAPSLVLPVARLFSPLLSVWFAREGDLARGNLIRQPGRAAITASTLMIGLATVVLIVAFISSMRGFVTEMATSNFSSDLMLMPQTLGSYQDVVGADASLAERIRALPEVETVGTVRYASSTIANKPLEVLGIDPNSYPKVAPFEFAEGNPDDAYAQLSTGRNAIVNSLVAMALKIQVGGDLVIQTAEGPQTYRVIGIANELMGLKFNTIYLSQANLATDFHKAEDIMLFVNVKPDADVKAVYGDVSKILEDFPQFTASITGEYITSLMTLVNVGMDLFHLLGLIILIPSVLGLVNTLTINVMERTREIGVVRAVGGSRKQVRRIVMVEALLLGLFGAAMGVVTGVAISYGFIAAFGLVGWKMSYTFPLMGLVAAIILGVIVALFASILPARNAAKLDIVRALQYE